LAAEAETLCAQVVMKVNEIGWLQIEVRPPPDCPEVADQRDAMWLFGALK
jgi:hypothetical protein